MSARARPAPDRGADDEAGVGLSGARRAVAITCLLAGIVLVVLDASIANVALPTLARALRVTPAAAVWVISAYQTGLVMALLPCAAIAARAGHRRVYSVGVALFVGASVACASAGSLHALVAARFIQGLGGAAIMALGVALLRHVVPQRELGVAIGWNALAVALASAAGPTLGALVMSTSSWRWLFVLGVPLGALVLLATRALPPVPATTQGLDLVSVCLNATAFGALIAGAGRAPREPVLAASLLAIGATAAAALVRRELPKPNPLIPLDLLRGGSFRVSVIASVCAFVGQSAAMVSLPFHLQHGHGLSALRTGLVITPWPLAVAVVAPLAGRLADRVSGALLCALGGALLALGLASVALWPPSGGALAMLPLVALCGVGFGLFQVPNNRNLLLSAPRARSGAAGAMQGTARLTGQTVGAVIVTLLFTTTSLDLAPRIGLLVAAAFTLFAGIISMLRADGAAGKLSEAR